MSLAKNIEFLRRLPKVGGINGFAPTAWAEPTTTSRLSEHQALGSNPGDLRMFSFVPQGLRANSALVVVLHGCTQSAASYDIGAGWSTLAARYGFALLMPQQKASNNANGCFNWFQSDDIGHGRGEALSIRQMIRTMVDTHRLAEDQIFVTGLSAGGAMTSVMLAAYPDVFAAGAIIAGLPYGVATNLQRALLEMHQAPPRPASELGDLVRAASSYAGPWPRISVWHGSADPTVNPQNADAIIKQWLDVHQLPMSPMSEVTVDGYPRQVWWDGDGKTVVESYRITDMAHGTPLGTGEGFDQCGSEGAFLIEAGISSSYHIASFFGLTRTAQPAFVGATDELAASTPTGTEVDFPKADFNQPPKSVRPRRRKQSARIDVAGVIAKALTAAGLMKE